MSRIDEIRKCRYEIGCYEFMLTNEEIRQDAEMVEIISGFINHYKERLEQIGKEIKLEIAR